MKLSIDTAGQFRNQFIAYNRDNFTCQGYELLFEHFEDIDPDMVLDVIAICCDFSEDTVEGIAEAHGLELPEDETEDQHRQAVFDYLNENTILIGDTAKGFVYANF